MPDLQSFPVVTTSGLTGQVFRASRFLDRAQASHVRLDDGREFEVPASALTVRPDGSFLLTEDGPTAPPRAEPPRATPVPAAQAAPVTRDGQQRDEPRMAPPPAAPPAAQERRSEVYSAPAPVAAAPVAASGPPAASIPREALFADDVSVERVPVNRFIDGPVSSRQEGDTLVVPVTEEVLVVQKRLLLKEEVRVTRRRVERPESESRAIVLDEPDAPSAPR